MAETGISLEGKRYILDVMFRGAEPVRQFWVGLARYPKGPEVTLAALTALEPVSGYARQVIFPLDWTIDKDSSIESRKISFENIGKNTWPVVEVAFVATSKDGAGILLAWGPLDRSWALMPGDMLVVPLRIGF